MLTALTLAVVVFTVGTRVGYKHAKAGARIETILAEELHQPAGERKAS